VKYIILSIIILMNLNAAQIENKTNSDDIPMSVHEINDKDRKKIDRMWNVCMRCHGEFAEKSAFNQSAILANQTPQWIRNKLDPYLKGTVTGCMAKVLKKEKKVKISPIFADKISIYVSEFPEVDELQFDDEFEDEEDEFEDEEDE